MNCSRHQDPDVFDMMHGSYGTLAVLTRLTFELIPAAPYVHLRYRTLTTAPALLAELRAACADADLDFIDGIVHGPNKFVLCLGTFVDSAPYVSDYTRSRIFYASTAVRAEDYLTTEDYCFRYDTDCHWMTRTVPVLQFAPVRWLLGHWLLGSTNLIRASRRLSPLLTRRGRPDVVCDIFIPSRRFEEFFAWYETEFRFFPLWVVPYRAPRDYPWISSDLMERARDDLYIDCAIYGRSNNEPDRDYSELLERKVFEFDGLKTLIGRNHYTLERFWAIYNRPNWQAVKLRLDPKGVLPDLYGKWGRVG
jgi:FAD/FMN-containing dehydrogenase